MQIHFLRHATLILTIHGLRLLVDPMLSEAEAMEPIANAGNQRRIPMVPLPLTDEQLQKTLQEVDALLVTHTHRDHWDTAAQRLLAKNLPLFCQPEDVKVFQQAGFTKVRPIEGQVEWRGIEIWRTGGEHGSGELGKKMGPVSGFVLKAEGEPTIYIAGDTIWCEPVAHAMEKYEPQIIVLNAGAATYATGGGPITMNDEDVCQVCRTMPEAQIVAVHMETVNHCLLTRAALRARVEAERLTTRILIPGDGDELRW